MTGAEGCGCRPLGTMVCWGGGGWAVLIAVLTEVRTQHRELGVKLMVTCASEGRLDLGKWGRLVLG